MDTSEDDSSDDENIAYLIATGILPGFESNTTSSSVRGSKHGKRPNTARDFNQALHRLQNDYFNSNPRYDERSFERRFRMPRQVFNRVFNAINGRGIFVCRADARHKPGIHPLQRVTAALRMLAYGTAADSLDEYLQMSEDSVLLSLKAFCREVVDLFGSQYLREPKEEDLRRIMSLNAARGFPGCIGSIDCQHWSWKNCPIAWVGQYKGKEKKPTIVLEAIADGELWIWHAFAGSPGSLNDINVLDKSTTVERIIAGEFPPCYSYEVNGKERSLMYYLADGIYPNWAIFAKTIKEAEGAKLKMYAKAQEALRKDVEKAFGVLISRFHILERPSRMWYTEDIMMVLRACIILHNMIVESRRDSYDSGMSCHSLSVLQYAEEAQTLFSGGNSFEWQSKESLENRLGSSLPPGLWATTVASHESRITSAAEHFSLKQDLIEHIWKRQGN